MLFKKKNKLVILFAVLSIILLGVVVMILLQRNNDQSVQKTPSTSETVSEAKPQVETYPFEIDQKIIRKQFEVSIINYEFLDEVQSATKVIKPEQQFLKVIFSIENQQQLERSFDFRKIQLTYQGQEIDPNEEATYIKNNTQSGNAIVGSFVHGDIPMNGEKTGVIIFDVPMDINLAELLISVSR